MGGGGVSCVIEVTWDVICVGDIVGFLPWKDWRAGGVGEKQEVKGCCQGLDWCYYLISCHLTRKSDMKADLLTHIL